MFPLVPLVPKLRLGTPLSPQLCCPVSASTHDPGPTTETEFSLVAKLRTWPRRICAGKLKGELHEQLEGVAFLLFRKPSKPVIEDAPRVAAFEDIHGQHGAEIEIQRR